MQSVRVAILADTHGFLDPRIAEVVAGCDHAVHAGDIGGRAVVQSLRPRGRVLLVAGNNDTPRHWPTADQDLLEALPEKASLALPGGLLVVEHGHRVGPARRRHERLRARYPDARAVVCGHSHRLVCDTGTAPWVLNPGAAGRTRTFGGPSCIVLDAGRRDWHCEALRYSLSEDPGRNTNNGTE